MREQEALEQEKLERKNRRDTLVVIAVTIVLIVAAIVVAKWLDPGYSKKPLTREEEGLLDDRIIITAYGKSRSQVEKAVDAAFEEIRRVDSIADRYDPESEISMLNAGAAKEPVEVSEELWEMISLGKEAYEASGGLFDITVGPLVDLWDVTGRKAREDPPPTEEEIKQAREKVGGNMLVLDKSRRSVYFSRPGMVVDLGGLAKGYALDRAAEALRDGGVQAGVINMISTIQLIGAKPEKAGGPDWEVVIMNPREGDYLGDLRLPADTLISTSGDYQRYFEYEGVRYHHILDPRTGYPAQGAISATMIGGASGVWSDIMSTALFIMGYPEGLSWAEGAGNCELVMVDREGAVHSTPGVRQWAESLAERI